MLLTRTKTSKKTDSLWGATLWECCPEEVDELEQAQLIIVLAAVELVEHSKDFLMVKLEALAAQKEEKFSDRDFAVVVHIYL